MIVIEKCLCVAETARSPYQTDERADPKCKLCDGNGELRIKVHYDPKPIPIRTADWDACLEDDPESGSGCGLTKKDAVENLLDWLELKL